MTVVVMKVVVLIKTNRTVLVQTNETANKTVVLVLTNKTVILILTNKM